MSNIKIGPDYGKKEDNSTMQQALVSQIVDRKPDMLQSSR